MKIFFSNLVDKIENSFMAALRGEEQIKILIRYWGMIAYLFFYFVVRKIMEKVDSAVVDYGLDGFAVIFFIWHIYVMKRCSPKKPKLSKEEKKARRKEAIKNAPRAFMRKLFLQEPITKWNPILMTIVMDLLFLLHFLNFIL